MKKTIYLLLFINCLLSFSDNVGYGYYVTTKGDTIKDVVFSLPEKFDFISYKNLQKGIYKIENGEKVLLSFDLKFIHIDFNNESLNYMPVIANSNFDQLNNTPLFLKIYQNSKIKVLEYFYGNSLFGTSINCSNDNSLSKSIFLILTETNNLVAFHQNFRSAVDLLFVNCPEGAREVKRQMLDCLDVPNIATVYENFCK
ncbi:MAG: hypothetical protein U0V72_11405 [Cytophagales bacterium]